MVVTPIRTISLVESFDLDRALLLPFLPTMTDVLVPSAARCSTIVRKTCPSASVSVVVVVPVEWSIVVCLLVSIVGRFLMSSLLAFLPLGGSKTRPVISNRAESAVTSDTCREAPEPGAIWNLEHLRHLLTSFMNAYGVRESGLQQLQYLLQDLAVPSG
jgi:hypothetical protein